MELESKYSNECTEPLEPGYLDLDKHAYQDLVEPAHQNLVEPAYLCPAEPTDLYPIKPAYLYTVKSEHLEPDYELPVEPRYEDPVEPTYEDTVEPTYEDSVEPTYEDPVEAGYDQHVALSTYSEITGIKETKKNGMKACISSEPNTCQSDAAKSILFTSISTRSCVIIVIISLLITCFIGAGVVAYLATKTGESKSFVHRM